MLRIFISLTLFLFSGFYLNAQSVLENTRYLESWNTIKTDKFNIIYPVSFQAYAPEVAALLDTLYTLGAETISDRPSRKISYVIRNQQAISNGFVGWGPWRSELFIAPPQDYRFLGTNDWMRKLVVHEYRHVAQYTQSIKGLSKLVFGLTGQNTFSSLAYAVVPQWFWEGDAVLAETALTRSGRGRLGGFRRIYRTNLMETERFNFSKQYLGSYKDNVPNHYVLGNYMVPYLRRATNDPMVWEKVMERSMKAPLLPFMFSWSMKKESGMNIKSTYKKMMDDLEEEWESEWEDKKETDYSIVLNSEDKFYTDYSYPVAVGKDSILYLKSGLEDIAQIRVRTANEDSKVHIPGIINASGMWFADQDYAVWNEYTFHERWRAENYSDIKILNLNTGLVTRLTRRKRYYGAAMSPDHSAIVTSTTSKEYQHSIVILNSSNGDVIAEWSDALNSHFTHVRFFDNNTLLAVKTNLTGKSMVLIDKSTFEEETLITPSEENFGFPIAYREEQTDKDYVLYVSDRNGTDNIYAVDAKSKERFQVTDVKYGAYNPYPSGDSLLFNLQKLKGLKIASMPLRPSDWQAVRSFELSTSSEIYEQIAEQEGHNVSDWVLDTANYESKPYRKLLHIFNLHSWGPFVNTSLSEAQIGLYSKNILNNTDVYGGISFNRFTRDLSYEANLSIQSLFPILNFGYTKTSRRESFPVSFDPEPLNLSWIEDKIDAEVELPLVFTNSKYLRELRLSYGVNFSRVTNYENNQFSGRYRIFDDNSVFNLWGFQTTGDFIYDDWSIEFFNILKRAHRHVEPRWGQSLQLNGRNTWSGDLFGGQFSATSRLYFPGVLKSHSLNGYFAFQKNEKLVNPEINSLDDLNNYWFNRRIPGPRGQSIPTWENLYTMGINYHFPLWSPDIALGPLFYLKRIRLIGFFDSALGTDEYENDIINSRIYRSAGGEMRFDFHLMRFKPEIRAGFRYAYGFGAGDFFEVVFPEIRF